MKIELHIERLIFDGLLLDEPQGPALKAAVEQELARLLGSEGINPRYTAGGTVRAVRAADIAWTAGQDAAPMGQAIARSIIGGIGK